MNRKVSVTGFREAAITVDVPVAGPKTYTLRRQGDQVFVSITGSIKTEYAAVELFRVADEGLRGVFKGDRRTSPSVYSDNLGPHLNICGLPYYHHPEEFRRLLVFIYNFCR